MGPSKLFFATTLLQQQNKTKKTNKAA